MGSGELAVLPEPVVAVEQRPGRRPQGTGPGWLARGEHLGLGLRVAIQIAKVLPGPIRYRLADLGGTAAYGLFPKRAAVARENYRFFTSGDHTEVARLTRSAYRNYARTLLDFLVVERLLEQLLDSPGAVSLEPIRRELGRGKGLIVVTPHFGNWDLGAAATATCTGEVHAVADQFGPTAVDSLVRAARERLGVKVIPTGSTSARAALRVLRQGGILCLAADIDTEGSGVAVSFLGRQVYLPAGPATLALRTGASLVPGYLRRLPKGGHEARMLEPITMPAESGEGSPVRELTQRMAAAFEEVIRTDPGQWFAFHRLVTAGRPAGPAA